MSLINKQLEQIEDILATRTDAAMKVFVALVTIFITLTNW